MSSAVSLGDLVSRAIPPLEGDTARDSWPERVNTGVALDFGFDFLTASSFQGAISSNRIAGLRTFSVACEPHLVFRDTAHLDEDALPYYLLTLQVAGSKKVAQYGRANRIRAGEFTLYDSEAPIALEIGRGYRSVNIRLPKAGIAGEGEQFSELIAEPISLRDGVASVVWTTLLSLDQHAHSIGREADALSGHASELAAIMLRSRRAADGADGRGSATRISARLLEIMAYADRHLGDPDLTVESIAAANYLSVRMVHKLFADHGQTAAAWIRSRRVEGVRLELSDPCCTDSLSAVAARWGFTSMPHFSAVFKKHTGLTPSTYRRFGPPTARSPQ